MHLENNVLAVPAKEQHQQSGKMNSAFKRLNKQESYKLSDNTFIKGFRQRKTALIALIVLVLLVCMAILAPSVAPYDPAQQLLSERFQGSTSAHWMGTDRYGRDVLSRIIWGARASLYVGVLSVLMASVLGTLIALLVTYFSAFADTIMMRVIDVLMAFPPLLLAIVFVSIIGPGLTNIVVAIGLATIPQFARVVRSEVLEAKEQLYVEAVRALGASGFRILFSHVLRNIWTTIVVIASLQIANAILLEATLSFFGLGVTPPTSSWGHMISVGRKYLFKAPWLSFFPGMFIVITVLSLNLFGDGLRDAFDPHLKGEKVKK